MPPKKKQTFRVGGEENAHGRTSPALTVRLMSGTHRAGRWRVEGYPRGQKGKQRTKARSGPCSQREARKQAEALADDDWPNERQPTTTPAEEVNTIKDLCLVYITVIRNRPDLSPRSKLAYEGSLRRIEAHIGELSIMQTATAGELYRDRYLRARKGQGTGTVLQDIRLLRQAVKYFIRRDWRLVVPGPVNLRQRRTYNHSTPAAADVLAVLNDLHIPWNRAAVCLLWGTGARADDIALLTWADVTESAVTIPEHSKTGRRVIPLTPRAKQGIRILREDAQANGRLTTGPTSIWPISPRTGRPVQVRQITTIVARRCERLGVPHWNAHGLRRLAVDTMREAGVPVEVVAAVIGHSRGTMMQHYRGQVSPMAVRAALERVPLGEVPRGEVTEMKKK